MSDSSMTIKKVCEALNENDIDLSREIINEEYPFVYVDGGKRSYTLLQILKIFIRKKIIQKISGKIMNE